MEDSLFGKPARNFAPRTIWTGDNLGSSRVSAALRPRLLALLLTAIVIAADVGALPECLPRST